MCHRFTMLTPDEVDRILAHLHTVARLMDAGALCGTRDDACALPPLRRPHDIQDIDAFPGSECQVIVMGAPTADATQEAALREDSRVFHVKHSDERENSSDACRGRAGTPNANARDGATGAPSARALAEGSEAPEAKPSSEEKSSAGAKSSLDPRTLVDAGPLSGATSAFLPAEVSPVRMFHVKHPGESDAPESAPPDAASDGAVGTSLGSAAESTLPGSAPEVASSGTSAEGGGAGDGGNVGAVERAVSSAVGGGIEAGGPLSTMAARLEHATLTWGINVPWKTGLVFNTRIESALGGNALWRDALAEGRCLVPVRAFFETRNVEPPSDELPLDGEAGTSSRAGRGRRPQFRFASPGGEALLLAGLRQGDRFTVVTTEPNDAVAPVHSRMPLALSPAEALVWLTGTADELAALADRARIALESAEQPHVTRTKAPNPDQLSLF